MRERGTGSVCRVADLHVSPTCCLETLEVTMINAFARQARVGRVCIAPDWQVCLETLEVTMINAFARQARVGRVCIAPDWQATCSLQLTCHTDCRVRDSAVRTGFAAMADSFQELQPVMSTVLQCLGPLAAPYGVVVDGINDTPAVRQHPEAHARREIVDLRPEIVFRGRYLDPLWHHLVKHGAGPTLRASVHLAHIVGGFLEEVRDDSETEPEAPYNHTRVHFQQPAVQHIRLGEPQT
eukprot:s1853_g1.t1